MYDENWFGTIYDEKSKSHLTRWEMDGGEIARGRWVKNRKTALSELMTVYGIMQIVIARVDTGGSDDAKLFDHVGWKISKEGDLYRWSISSDGVVIADCKAVHNKSYLIESFFMAYTKIKIFILSNTKTIK